MAVSAIKRVICGISGGVDSAIAAALLKQKGYEVIGAFMKNWDDQDEEGTCQITQEEDYQDAKSVCNHLRIPFVEVSFVKDYWNEVFSRLLEDYENGFTPNPDVLCNKYIKFGSFYRHSKLNWGADAIATGHYAQSSFGNYLEAFNPSKVAFLKRAVDPTKDQTLFLSDISQEPLQRTMFPLGGMHKFRVRQIAKDIGLEKLAKKRDSVGICFIGDRRFSNFISKYIDDRPGLFIDVDTGKVLGEHNGVHQFTLGQRCRIGGCPGAYYVCLRDPKTQTILAALGRDHPALYSEVLTVGSPNWISYNPLETSLEPYFRCMFKFQHTEWTIPCVISANAENMVTVNLSIPTRALTPGQQAVFYKGDICLGSAKILHSESRFLTKWNEKLNLVNATNNISGKNKIFQTVS